MPRKKKDAEPESTPKVKIEIEPVAEPEDKPVKKARARKKAKAAEEQLADPIAALPEIPVPEPTPEAEAEAVAHAEDTFGEAFEANDPSEIPPVIAEAEPAAAESVEETEDGEEEQPTFEQPPAKLERLQKILAKAGIASRRHAEELITGGRVQVNGQVVTELGSKADPARDHIRVDGKLLQGAERHRYFLLNKPKGYVTTVSDPEGRPTVMEFFSKLGERLYPVGRLDYLSEGLLLVTNDGDLANKLTRAASGVEKIYLVKVSGQPDDEAIEQLREGVSIERGAPGKGRVRTSPAKIRQVRQGDNPWFEVILTEGRNRELRKMFEEIGHHVEKIRRVGYGPLVLDVEPGKIRELDPEELEALRLAAEGKWKPRKLRTANMLPKEAGRTVDYEADKRRGGKPLRSRSERPGSREERPRTGPGRGFERRGVEERRPAGPPRDRAVREGEGRGFGERPRGSEQPRRGEQREGFAARGGQRPFAGRPQRREQPGESTQRPAFRPSPNRPVRKRPEEAGERPRGGQRREGSGAQNTRFDRQGGGEQRRSFGDRPRPSEQPRRSEPRGGLAGRGEQRRSFEGPPPRREQQGESTERRTFRPRPERPFRERTEEAGERPRGGQRREGSGQTRRFDRPPRDNRSFGRSEGARETGAARPPRREGNSGAGPTSRGPGRPSAGPRGFGARAGSKPAGRPSGGSGSRPGGSRGSRPAGGRPGGGRPGGGGNRRPGGAPGRRRP